MGSKQRSRPARQGRVWWEGESPANRQTFNSHVHTRRRGSYLNRFRRRPETSQSKSESNKPIHKSLFSLLSSLHTDDDLGPQVGKRTALNRVGGVSGTRDSKLRNP